MEVIFELAFTCKICETFAR